MRGCPHLAVLLLNGDAATDHIVLRLVLQHLTILVDGDADFLGEGLQHGVIGGRFTHGVIAIGESIGPRGGHAAGVGSDGHSYLAGLGRAAIYHHGIGRLVHDFKRNPRQACVALRGCSCLAVFLLNGEATTLHFLGDVIGDKLVSIIDKLATINVISVDYGIQLISGGWCNFLNSDFS